MAVGFVRLAQSFQTMLEDENSEKKPEKEKLLQEFLPSELPPIAKNPEFQNELIGSWFGYRYAIVRIRSNLVQQLAIIKGAVPGDSSQRNLIEVCMRLELLKSEMKPHMTQLRQMIDELRGFEDRIVALMEEENPLPRVDTIQEMHNRLIEGFK